MPSYAYVGCEKKLLNGGGLYFSQNFTLVPKGIDGTLIRVPRFAEHEGWYCRKGFPDFDLLLVVDHLKRARACSLRTGSNNDQGVLNRSKFARD
jgi:hypothetical protein